MEGFGTQVSGMASVLILCTAAASCAVAREAQDLIHGLRDWCASQRPGLCVGHLQRLSKTILGIEAQLTVEAYCRR